MTDMTPNERIARMTTSFLEEAEQVLLYDLQLATGKPVSLRRSEISTQSHDRIIKDVMDLIKAHALTRKIEVQTTHDVLKLLKTGKVTIGEALQLMGILREKFNIEELPKKLLK